MAPTTAAAAAATAAATATAAAAAAVLAEAPSVPAPDGIKGEEMAPEALAPAGRWNLTDGASDLAERGIEAVGAGSYLPSSVPMPDGVGRQGRKRSRQARAVEEEAEVGVFLSAPGLPHSLFCVHRI